MNITGTNFNMNKFCKC